MKLGFFNHFAHQLRQSLANHRRGDSLRISTLPAEVRALLERAGRTDPNQCYRNCCFAVSEHIRGARYVLCRVSCEGSVPQGHAILKIGRHYYDPTLEAQPRFRGATYVFWAAFSRKKLHEFLREAHSNSPTNARGEVEVIPPNLHMNGTICCEEDPDAPYTPHFMKHN